LQFIEGISVKTGIGEGEGQSLQLSDEFNFDPYGVKYKLQLHAVKF
jgi:hypothetical protein